MQFTVVKLFNHKSFGLESPHYAVVAAMPGDMGGGQRVVDMFPVTDVEHAEKLREAFAQAKDKMPHRLSPEGDGEIDFYTQDHKGNDVKQSTAYIPAKSLTGECFEEALLNWLSWRARVALWRHSGKRPVLDTATEARILETVVAPEAILPHRGAWEAQVVSVKHNDYMGAQAPAPLTRGLAPL